jgi:hypothetical protein
MGRFPSIPQLSHIDEGLQHWFNDRTHNRRKTARQASFGSLTHLRITLVASDYFSVELQHSLKNMQRHASISIMPQKTQVVVDGMEGVCSDGICAPLLENTVRSMVTLRPKSVEFQSARRVTLTTLAYVWIPDSYTS